MRQLDWQQATAAAGRISVPLDGTGDDYWLDRFHEARSNANRVRRLGNLPHLQIELRDDEVAVTGIREGEHDSVRLLLAGLVEAANQRPGGRSGRQPS